MDNIVHGVRNEGYAGYGTGGIYEHPYKPEPIVLTTKLS